MIGNILSSIGRGVGRFGIPALAGYGAYKGIQGIRDWRKARRARKNATAAAAAEQSKLANMSPRDRWIYEQDYIPQSQDPRFYQRRGRGGQTISRGRKVPGMYNDL